MAIIGSIGGLQQALFNRAATPVAPVQPMGKPLQAGEVKGPGEAGFGKLFEGMVDAVESKQAEARALTKEVLLGNNDQLHQSVIAMQEASVAFGLMVEVRNKLVDSYQELMRMPV
jgi:flagellar hook-basal body complex protein FliE